MPRLIWVAAIALSAAALNAQNTVSVHDLDARGSLSKQQILVDVGALAKARKDSRTVTSLSESPGNTGGGRIPSDSAAPQNNDMVLSAEAARARALALEDELQKAMTRAEINAAVRSWDQLTVPTKLKTPSDFQEAIKKPSKRSDAIRALAVMIANDLADVRRFLPTRDAALLLQAQSSDPLTGACASLVLSRMSLSTDQVEQMRQELSKQRIETKSDPVIQHLIDLASPSIPR